jgi:hypothetical protein
LWFVLRLRCFGIAADIAEIENVTHIREDNNYELFNLGKCGYERKSIMGRKALSRFQSL